MALAAMATNGRDVNRAERFEDEKRRIIDSCFNKRDDDGSGKLDPRPPTSGFGARAPSRRCVSIRKEKKSYIIDMPPNDISYPI